MSLSNYTPADIEQRLAATREQLGTLRTQRAALEAARSSDPYGTTHLVGALTQARQRISVLEQQVTLLEREANRHQSADERSGMINSGQVWVGAAHGDSRGGNY